MLRGCAARHLQWPPSFLNGCAETEFRMARFSFQSAVPIEVSVWQAPTDRGNGSRGLPWRASLIAAAVACFHFAAWRLLEIRNANHARELAQSSTMFATLIEDPGRLAAARMTQQQMDGVAEVSRPSLKWARPPEMPEFPPLPEIPKASVPEEMPASTEFAPPRLDSSESLPNIHDYASRASIVTGTKARVILRIEVLVDGTVGNVSVETTSGIPQADAAAVEYARALKWKPGLAAGRAQTMTIRFPVLF
jgi:TonB family protein